MLERSWRRAAVAVSLGVLAIGPLGPTTPAVAQDAGDVVDVCAPLADVPEVGPRACKSEESGGWLIAQVCRLVVGREEAVCPSIDGRPVHEAALAAFEASWLGRALALQRRLDLDVPLSQALFPHTHNSANSSAYPPSVSTLDANQVLSLTDQLRLGMRAIEIDVHWTPNLAGDPAEGFRAVVQCHGEPVETPVGVVHAGCSTDMLLVDLLHEVRQWLDANPTEVVLLYLENALDGDPAAHAAAVAAIEAELGDLVARPEPGGACQPLPVHRSKQDLLDAGTRVLITGNCGPGGWTGWVFERGDGWDESGGSTFDCAQERAEIAFDDTLVRRYEDSTWLSAMAGSGSHLDAATMTEMVRCGVNLVGFDQLHAGDDRLPSLVWSWRVDEPAADTSRSCAALGSDGRFFASTCASSRPAACRTAAGGWAVTADAVAWAHGDVACRAAGHVGAGVPANGWDSAALRAAADEAGAPEVWLAYAQEAGGVWVTGTSVPSSEAGTAGPAGPEVLPTGGSRDRLPATGGTTRLLPAAVLAFVALAVRTWQRRGFTVLGPVTPGRGRRGGGGGRW